MKKNFWFLNILHIFNDGYEASFLLLLPFIAKEMHINLAQVGILGTINNGLEIFIAFPAGYLAAKYGGKKIILFGVFMYCLGYLLTGFAPSLHLLFCTFFITGIGFGSFHSVALALISRLADKTNRGKIMGNFMAIGDIGRIGISTISTFIIVLIGWRLSTVGYAIIGFILLLVLYFLTARKTEIHQTYQEEEIYMPVMQFFKNKLFLLANLTNFLDSLASSSLFIFLPFLLLKRGMNPAMLGTFTAVFFAGNFLGKTVLGRLTDTHGTVKIFIISEICMAIFIIILANIPSVIAIMIASIILGIFTKGTGPINKTMLTEAIEKQGNFEKAFGINGIVASIAVTLAPLTLGFISNSFGIISAFNISALFALSAILPAFGFHFAKSKESNIRELGSKIT